MDWGTLVGSLGGVLLGGLFALAGAWLQSKQAANREALAHERAEEAARKERLRQAYADWGKAYLEASQEISRVFSDHELEIMSGAEPQTVEWSTKIEETRVAATTLLVLELDGDHLESLQLLTKRLCPPPSEMELIRLNCNSPLELTRLFRDRAEQARQLERDASAFLRRVAADLG